MNALTLWQRLALVFAGLLMACFIAAAAVQMAAGQRHVQRTEQQLHRRLAAQVSDELAASTTGRGLAAGALSGWRSVTDRLSRMHPGVDAYLLDHAGTILQHPPGPDAPALQRVDLGPVRDLLAGRALPVLGTDPADGRSARIFSVAPHGSDGRPPGYVYIVLHGRGHDQAAGSDRHVGSLQIVAWSVGLVAPLGILGGLFAFRWVTQPLTQLTLEVQAHQRASPDPPGIHEVDAGPGAGSGRGRPARDEIEILRRAFDQLVRSNREHWNDLALQDQQRREWLAQISHDLRTPLATMQGYLETVLLRSTSLSGAERAHYLRTALSECQRLGRLAQALLDLARLEMGAVKPVPEDFSLVELTQDVMQKLALSAAARQKRLVPEVEPGPHRVTADIGMVERILTNLLDNAIRHTPPGGEVRVSLRGQGDDVRLVVADQGPGLPDSLRVELALPMGQRLPTREGGGLGLAVVQQMLQLHGRTLSLSPPSQPGTAFHFDLPRSR